MASPVFYTQLSLLLSSLVISVIFFLAWRTLGRHRYTLNWSIAFLASGLYWLVMMVPGLFPGFEVQWLTANAFGLVLVTLGLRGHCQRTDCDLLPKHLWPAAVFVFGVLVFTTAVKPHAGLSAALLPGIASVTLLLSALIILRHRSRARSAEWAAAVTMVLFAVVTLWVAWRLFGLGSDSAVVFAKLYEHPTFMAMPAGFIGIAMFVIFMLASDLSEDMREMAVRDQLTGLLNRRGFGEQAAKAYAWARRSNRPVSVIMTDIDHFKEVNDAFGHAAGDDALVQFADLLTSDRRAEDIVARLGGEEFALVLPGTNVRQCIAIADELCERLGDSPLDVDGRAIDMTASFGVATISDKDTCLTDIIVRADRALYRSKRSGRNRVDLESSQMMRALDGTLKSVAS